MKNWRITLLVIVVVAVIATGFFVYLYFSKSQTPMTAGWKTYTNDEYGFKFSYPEKVTVKQDGNIIMVHDTRQGWPFDWTMTLYQNNKRIDLADWINSQFNSFNEESDKDCKIVPSDKYGLRINIKDSYTLMVDAPSYEASCSHVGYYTMSPDKLTIMLFSDVQASPEPYQDILSTFTFTK